MSDLNDTSEDSRNTSNYEVNEEYLINITNINLSLCKNIETKYKQLSTYITSHIDKNLQILQNYCKIQEKILNKEKNDFESIENNLELYQNNITINKYLQSMNNDINIQYDKKVRIEEISDCLKLLDNINNENLFLNNDLNKPEKQILKINKLKKNLKPKKNPENSEINIEQMKIMKLDRKREDKKNNNSEYTCFSPLNNNDYMVFGNKYGEIEIYDFSNNNNDSTLNENDEGKYQLKSRIKVFDDEIKHICELDEDLFAVSQKKNEIKIINKSSIIQTICIDDYDDTYIYSMISLPLFASQKKRHFLCVATDTNILIYKSNKTPNNIINDNENEDNEEKLYFEKYKDIKLDKLTHCLIEANDKYLVAGCPNDKTIKFFNMNNDFRESANITDINMTSGSNIFTLIPNKNILIVACNDGFKLISIEKKRKYKSVHCTYAVLSLDMYNDNTIICCCSEKNKNIIKQYKINKNNFELQKLSQKRTIDNDEIWKLQKIGDKIFFIKNKKRIMFLA